MGFADMTDPFDWMLCYVCHYTKSLWMCEGGGVGDEGGGHGGVRRDGGVGGWRRGGWVFFLVVTCSKVNGSDVICTSRLLEFLPSANQNNIIRVKLRVRESFPFANDRLSDFMRLDKV